MLQLAESLLRERSYLCEMRKKAQEETRKFRPKKKLIKLEKADGCEYKLVSFIKQSGYQDIADFCTREHISENTIWRLAGLPNAPTDRRGHLFPSVLRLLEILKCTVDDIF